MPGRQPWTVFSIEILDKRSGYIRLRVSGKGSQDWLAEAGGHRWQRVPPTEKNGRVQTSTFTVAVLDEQKVINSIVVDPNDIEEVFTRGSGPGGQNRNKTETAVQLTHIPTGIMIRSETERSQKQNREIAMNLLKMRLLEALEQEQAQKENSNRKSQVGSGMRGDKSRTIQVKHNRVTNHTNGKEMSYKDYAKGKIKEIW